MATSKMELEKLRGPSSNEGKLLNHTQAFDNLGMVDQKSRNKVRFWQKVALGLLIATLGFLTLVGLGIIK